MGKTLFHASTVLAMGLLTWSYTQLPAKVAVHFGATGKPDAWASKTTYLLIGLGTLFAMWAMFAALPHIVKKTSPELINVPNKAHWLAPENIEEFQGLFTGYMYAFGLFTQLFFISLGYFVHQAQVANATLSLTPTITLLAIYLALIIGATVHMMRRFQV